MTHFGVLWPFFSKVSEPWPVNGWCLGNRSPLADVEKGDLLWLFTSGKKCKKKLEAPNRAGIQDSLGYLTQILEVDTIRPGGWLGLEIGATQRGVWKIDPPLLIDDVVRPPGWDSTAPIGRLRQCPWKLKGDAVDALHVALRSYHRPTCVAVFGS
jgi:hypothetical protein